MAAHALQCTKVRMQTNGPEEWAGICREQAALSHDRFVRDLLLEMAAEYEAIAANARSVRATSEESEKSDMPVRIGLKPAAE